jgi:hypothetical protein
MTRSQLFTYLILFCAAGCKKAPPPDPLCSIEPIPSTTTVAARQGAALVNAPTDEYVYFLDLAGKQIGSAHVNQAHGLKPGQYHARINGSKHEIYVQEKMLTRCMTGTLNATGSTEEYYYVLDSAGSQLASGRLNKSMSFFPGQYEVRVNTTRVTADVKPKENTEIKAGKLEVPGTTEEYYYVLDAGGTQLGSGRLNAPMSLLPGDWTVKVNNTKSNVKIAAGQTSRVETSTLAVQGTTDEYYYVMDNAGTQLASSKLGRPVALFPGEWQVRVNNTKLSVKTAAGETARLDTGALTVQGTGEEYYYVLDSAGQQLAYGKMNASVSLAAGNYTVRVAQQTKPAAVTAGQKTTLKW